MDQVVESAKYHNFTASVTLPGAGRITGIFVASSTSGTLKVQDGSVTVVNTFTASAGQFYLMPAELKTSCVITVGGTIDATLFWNT